MATLVMVCGSLRAASTNGAVVRAAAEFARAHPAVDDVHIARISSLPLFDEDVEAAGDPAEVVKFKNLIARADAVVISTPEYNASVPGVLKNAIDWASRPYGDSAWSGKPAAIMGASVGAIGTARAQYHLRQVMVFLNMFPVNQPEVMVGGASEHFDAEGNLTDEETREYVGRLLQSLVDWTRRIGQQGGS